jgi:hypothetical protein
MTYPDYQKLFKFMRERPLDQLIRNKDRVLVLQSLKTMNAIGQLVAALDEPEKMKELAFTIGKVHYKYGCRKEHFDVSIVDRASETTVVQLSMTPHRKHVRLRPCMTSHRKHVRRRPCMTSHRKHVRRRPCMTSTFSKFPTVYCIVLQNYLSYAEKSNTVFILYCTSS